MCSRVIGGGNVGAFVRLVIAPAGLLGIGLALLASSGAFALTRIHVKIQAPRTVSAGQKVVLIISGYTRRPYTLLAFFYDNRSCARTGLAEEARRESREFLLHRSGSFRIMWTIKSSKPGVHYDCAYLMRNGRPHDTKARAGAHYLTS